MLIVRGVNVFPTAVREIVSGFAPAVSGVIAIRPTMRQVKQEPPLPVAVEIGEATVPEAGLAAAIEARIREALSFTATVELVPFGTLAPQRVQVEAGRVAGGLSGLAIRTKPQPCLSNTCLDCQYLLLVWLR